MKAKKTVLIVQLICFIGLLLSMFLVKNQETKLLVSMIAWLGIFLASLFLAKRDKNYGEKNKTLIISQGLIFLMFLFVYIKRVFM